MTCALLQFEFVRAKDQDGLYEICDVTTVDIERVEKIADNIIKENEACNGSLDAIITTEYCYDYLHNPGCPMAKYDPQLEDFLGPQRCIEEEANEAKERKRRLNRLYLLKECARNPSKANELGTLDGMAQDSCIYNTKYVNATILVILV